MEITAIGLPKIGILIILAIFLSKPEKDKLILIKLRPEGVFQKKACSVRNRLQ